jgi:hypothetical protein
LNDTHNVCTTRTLSLLQVALWLFFLLQATNGNGEAEVKMEGRGEKHTKTKENKKNEWNKTTNQM